MKGITLKYFFLTLKENLRRSRKALMLEIERIDTILNIIEILKDEAKNVAKDGAKEKE